VEASQRQVELHLELHRLERAQGESRRIERRLPNRLDPAHERVNVLHGVEAERAKLGSRHLASERRISFALRPELEQPVQKHAGPRPTRETKPQREMASDFGFDLTGIAFIGRTGFENTRLFAHDER
jgi:hypothetical protein